MSAMSFANKVFSPIFVIVIVSVMSQSNVAAQVPDFKIEAAIYSGDQKTPAAQNITLFSQGLIFDFKVDNATPPNIIETKIYDSRQKQVALLKHSNKTQLELSDTRLLQMVDGQRRDISQKPDYKFLIDETYTETHEPTISQLILSSPTIKYRVVGEYPKESSRLPLFNEFLDTFTRLSSSHPGSFPPFARLRLNESIKKLGWIPSEVEVTMQPNALMPRGINMKSTHTVINGLSDDDRKKITTAKQQWLVYKKVDLLTFHGIKKPSIADSLKGAGKAKSPVKR